MDCLPLSTNYAGCVTSSDQKSFKKIPPKIMAAWSEFLIRRATSDQFAGPIAMFIATQITPEEWCAQVEAYWKYVKGDSPRPKQSETRAGRKQSKEVGRAKREFNAGPRSSRSSPEHHVRP
jgi:hypothetical protein